MREPPPCTAYAARLLFVAATGYNGPAPGTCANLYLFVVHLVSTRAQGGFAPAQPVGGFYGFSRAAHAPTLKDTRHSPHHRLAGWIPVHRRHRLWRRHAGKHQPLAVRPARLHGSGPVHGKRAHHGARCQRHRDRDPLRAEPRERDHRPGIAVRA